MTSQTLHPFLSTGVDIMTAVLFGMLAVWAVESRWHWFARTTVVGLALSAFLLFPAHELTIRYGTAVVVFVAGFAFLRRNRARGAEPKIDSATASTGRPWPRVSLRGLFLVTIVAAVALAVFVSAPQQKTYYRLFQMIDGAVIGCIGLSCAWLAVGRTRLWIRLVAAPFVVAASVFTAYLWLTWLSYRLLDFYSTSNMTFDKYWQTQWNLFLRHRWPGTLNIWATDVIIGIALFVAWLAAAKAAGWLAQPHRTPNAVPTTTDAASRRPTFAHWTTVFLTLAIAALPVYVWARVVAPHSLPPEAFESDQNYKELVAIADELYKMNNNGDFKLWKGNDAQIAERSQLEAPQWERVRELVAKGVKFPWVIYKRNSEMDGIEFLPYLLLARTVRGDGTGAVEPRVAACMDAIRLGQMEMRASGTNGRFVNAESDAELEFIKMRPKLNYEIGTQTARSLWQLDQEREPWADMAARSALLTENSGWYSRLSLAVAGLSGVESSHGTFDRQFSLRMKILMLELAIPAFWVDEKRLPTALDELVPKYLPILPGDPFGDGPLRYKLTDTKYIIYSVSKNGVDDGGSGDDIPNKAVFH